MFSGNHLNGNKEIEDEELELKNFEGCGKALAEIWNNVVFCGHRIQSFWLASQESVLDQEPNSEWVQNHVRVSR